MALAGGVAQAGSIDPVRNATQKINTSMRQATLMESMKQAACFAMTGVDRKAAQDAAHAHMDTYDTVLTGLRTGHEWLGLLPEDNAETKAVLRAMQPVWIGFSAVIAQVLDGDYHSIVVHQLIDGSQVAQEQSEDLAQHLLDKYGHAGMDLATRQGLVAAAAHRTRSQQVFTELCYVLHDIGGPAMVQRLQDSVDRFDKGFDDLAQGSGDIPKAPNARIERNLRTARLFWAKMRPVFDHAIAGDPVETAALEKALKFNRSVLKQLNQATEAYLP